MNPPNPSRWSDSLGSVRGRRSRDQIAEKHPTANTARYDAPLDVGCSMFDVRYWMFDSLLSDNLRANESSL